MLSRLSKVTVTLVALLITSLALAGSAGVNWTPATLNDDGSTLVDRTGYKVYYGQSAAALTQVQTTPANATSYTITGLSPGTWYISVTTLSQSLGESVKPAPVAVTIAQPKPLPPSNITAVQLIAYMALRQKDRFVMIPVGTVPADTKCDPNNGAVASGVSYFAVPTTSVVWSGTTRPEVVFAQCG